jgi:hypothetical protein
LRLPTTRIGVFDIGFSSLLSNWFPFNREHTISAGARVRETQFPEYCQKVCCLYYAGQQSTIRITEMTRKAFEKFSASYCSPHQV